MNKKYFLSTKALQAVDTSKASFTAVLTTEVIDRQGELVKVDGINTNDFAVSGAPIFLNHDYANHLANGKRRPDLPAEIWKADNKMMGTGYFHQKTKDSAAICALVMERIVSAVSIGFTSGRKVPTMIGQKCVKVVPQCDLFEWSVCTVLSANQGSGIIDVYSPQQIEQLKWFLGSPRSKDMPNALRASFKAMLANPSKFTPVSVRFPYQSVTEKKMADAAAVEVVDEPATQADSQPGGEPVIKPAMQETMTAITNLFGAVATELGQRIAPVADHQDAGFLKGLQGLVGGMCKQLRDETKAKFPDEMDLPEEAINDLDDYDPNTVTALFNELKSFNEGMLSDVDAADMQMKLEEMAG